MFIIKTGYRVDIYIKINEQYFKLCAYDMIRLKQDFDEEMEYYGYYAVEPNLILVKEVNKFEIIHTINKLHEQKYFDEIKPLQNLDESKLIRIN